MGFYNAKSPVMAYDGDFTYLVLPVNINKSDVEERINNLRAKIKDLKSGL